MKIRIIVCAIIAFIATYYVVESVQKLYAIDKKLTQVRDEQWRQAEELEFLRSMRRQMLDELPREMQRRELQPKVLCDSIIPQDCFKALWHLMHDPER